MISATDLRLTFGKGTPLENPALRGMSLTVNQGEFVTVIGSNGAGKSTFLNALARAARVARVFQDPLAGTCENLSIEENLALAIKRGQRRGLTSAVKRQYLGQFRESLSSLNLGLESRLGDKMGLLSGGQRQAVSLLMASLTPSSSLCAGSHRADHRRAEADRTDGHPQHETGTGSRQSHCDAASGPGGVRYRR